MAEHRDAGAGGTSAAQLRHEIEQEKKKAVRSLVLAVAALIAIIALCIAWFVANHLVRGGSSTISADMEEVYTLASAGDRQTVEKDHFLNDSLASRLSDGQEKTYSSYWDTETGKSVETGDKTYYIGSSGTAWRQAGQIEMEPGNSGRLDLYVIPKRSGLKKIDITLKLEGYKLSETATLGAKQKAVRIDDDKIQSLIDGHILLFRHLDDTMGYTNWLKPEKLTLPDEDAGHYGSRFTLTAEDAGLGTDAEFRVGTLYKVTVYWVWPKYIRNYVYKNRAQYGDLFTDATPSEDYNKILDYVNEQRSMSGDEGSQLFYPGSQTEGSAVPSIDFQISNTMTDEQLSTCSRYYNLADEWIGKDVQMVYVGALLD